MLRRPLRYAYEKLGPRYPRWASWVQFQFAYVVVLGGVGLLTLYVDLDSAAFWRILIVAEVFVLIENLVSAKIVNKLLKPGDPWLNGERTPDGRVVVREKLAPATVAQPGGGLRRADDVGEENRGEHPVDVAGLAAADEELLDLVQQAAAVSDEHEMVVAAELDQAGVGDPLRQVAALA